MHTLRHLLTPGTPSYAILKVSSLAALFGLQHAVRRRSARTRPAEPDPEALASEPSLGSREHSRSKNKRRRRH